MPFTIKALVDSIADLIKAIHLSDDTIKEKLPPGHKNLNDFVESFRDKPNYALINYLYDYFLCFGKIYKDLKKADYSNKQITKPLSSIISAFLDEADEISKSTKHSSLKFTTNHNPDNNTNTFDISPLSKKSKEKFLEWHAILKESSENLTKEAEGLDVKYNDFRNLSVAVYKQVYDAFRKLIFQLQNKTEDLQSDNLRKDEQIAKLEEKNLDYEARAVKSEECREEQEGKIAELQKQTLDLKMQLEQNANQSKLQHEELSAERAKSVELEQKMKVIYEMFLAQSGKTNRLEEDVKRLMSRQNEQQQQPRPIVYSPFWSPNILGKMQSVTNDTNKTNSPKGNCPG